MQNPNSEIIPTVAVTTPDNLVKNQNFDIMGFAPLVLVFIVFYFMIFRPQQQKLKAHRNLLEKLQRGDRVLTEGGIFAIIHRVVDDTEIHVEIAENVIIKMRRSAIVEIVSKNENQPKKNEPKEKKIINPVEKTKKK